ncbi:MAG: hypothetical protein ACLFN3_06390 [Halochromatium sp.]
MLVLDDRDRLGVRTVAAEDQVRFHPIGLPATQWWTQLASAIVGGLSFATLLTLVLTPC